MMPVRPLLLLSLLILASGCSGKNYQSDRAPNETEADCVDRLIHQSVGGGWGAAGSVPYESAIHACKKPPN